jgi:hypothetical protein
MLNKHIFARVRDKCLKARCFKLILQFFFTNLYKCDPLLPKLGHAILWKLVYYEWLWPLSLVTFVKSAPEDFALLRRLFSRSQWPRGLSSRSATRLLRSWVRIPPGAWIFVCCECRVLSGRGLCDELITRPEESYRLWCVVSDLETSRICTPYIYDISSLKFNDLTLILLMWRKWW